MSKTYINQSNTKRIVEPLFQITRAKFRGPRYSEDENVESNLIKLDLTRIELQLDDIDERILENITYFGGQINQLTEAVNLNDGLSYEIDDVELYFDDTTTTENVNIDVLNKLGSRLTRLMNKVNRLEIG